MFENIIKFFKNIGKKEDKKQSQENSKDAAKHHEEDCTMKKIVVLTGAGISAESGLSTFEEDIEVFPLRPLLHRQKSL